MPNGIKMEVESEKPLSGATTMMLLKDDSDIGSFLENVKILDVKIPNEMTIVNRKARMSSKKKRRKKQEDIAGPVDVQSENKIAPCDRINMMTTIQGEFTRLDYQKFMEDKGYKITDFMGHGDIEDAIMLKRIAPTGEKIGKGRRKYRIIDVVPVEQYMYRKMLKNYKDKMKY